MVRLSKRLLAIYDMVPRGFIADIGADHGKLIIALAENDIAIHGFAVENKPGPFKRLEKAIVEAGLENKIDVILGDGLMNLPPVVDTVIMAGMGGNLIVNILKRDVSKLENINTIIVEAHSAIRKVREEITGLGYVIADETIVEDAKKYYEIIKFVKADIAFLNNLDLEYGPILRKEKSYTFIEKSLARIKTIENLIENENLDQTRKEELEEEKRRIENIL